MQASAQTSCTKQGLTLVSFTGDEKCGKGSSSSGTYTCCSAAVLPAEPPTPAAP
jgi:hypothetical protein